MGINFLTRSETKISPIKAVTYPRYSFVDREVKKGKGSGNKITHQGWQNNYNASELWVKLNCDLKKTLKVRLKKGVKGIYIVEIWM